eukprot:gene30008-biopygen11769
MITFSEVSVRSLATSNIVNAPYPPLSGIRAQSGTSGLPTLSFANSPDTGLFNPSVGTLGVVAGGAELVRVSNNVSVLADIVVSLNIIPVKNATQHIGSSNMHFKEAWIDTLHISSNTLYVGDTLVLGIDAQTLAMSAGPGQGISITTTGAGETSLASEEGVNVTSVGRVTMHVTGIDKVVDIQSTGAGGIVQLGATKEVVLTAPITTVSSNLTVNGTNFTVGIRANSGSAGAPSLSFSNATDTGLFNPSVGTLGVVAGGAELVRVSNTVSVMGDLVVSSNIIPSSNATQYIGSSTMHFKEAWIDTLHISSNTLYIGNTAVLGTDDQTVSIRADPGQGISITTTGVGETSLVSESGVNVVAGGGVNMQVTGLNKVVDIQSSGAGGTVQLGATKEVVITTPLTTVSNNPTVSGNLTVNGSNFTVNTQTVTVEDNIIVLNSGEIGPGVTKGEAGITIDRGDALDYQLLFRESDDKFVMGPQGSLVPIATETFAANAGNIFTGVLGVTIGVSASTGTGSNVLSDNATMSNLTTIGGMINGNGSGLTALNANNISSGTLPVVRGGTGVSVSTGSGSNVLSDNATMSNLNIVGGIYQNGVPFKVGGGFDDGTVGFPSITFTSDSNTGLNRLGADKIRISTGGVLRVTILDNGNVGFATNAPGARLHVVGDGYFNGNVIATSNIIGFSTMESDSNVKHHFEPITDALDKIDAIGAYTFEYRGDDSRKRHAGVIAQQVQRVLPEVVDVHPLKDTLTVAYGNLSSLLLAGVQELRDEVNNLKEELKEIHCVLFENGGVNVGAYVGVRDVASGMPKLCVRGGIGGQAPPHAYIVYVDVYPIPADDLTHKIAFEFRTVPTEGVRVWIDGTLYGEATGSFHSANGDWSGNGPGSFGRVESTFAVGELLNPWPVSITKPLRRYDNQLGWLSAMEANLGTPDYVYSGPSTFESLILDTDTMFSMDVVIPTNFASSCILFDYGGSGSGLYIGVVRSQVDGSTVMRVIANNISIVDISDFPRDGRWHNIAFSLQKKDNDIDTSRVWIDGVLNVTSTGELGTFLSGSDGGGFGLSNRSVKNWQDTTPWPSSLRTICIYLNETGCLPLFGALSFADIAHEYGLSTTQPVALDSFYQNRPAITTGIWDTRRSALARKAFVGRLGTPNVLSDGSLSLLAFRGGRRKPPALARKIVTVPPQMNGFAEDVATELFAASFANTTQAQMESDGWIFNTDNVLTFESTFARSNRSGTISSPPVIDTLSGVGSGSLTLFGSSLEGDERVTFRDSANNIGIEPKDGSGRLLRDMNGFNDGILGEFISLRIPWPIYLTSYEMTGSCTDWVVYGSVDGKSFDVLDTQIGYLRGFYSEVVFVSSDVDGREYLMRRLPDRQNAANLMARINSNLNKLVQHLVAKYPKNLVVRQLYDNYNPDALSEGGAELGYTSYSVNKGEKIVLCLRQRDHELVEENILMYVAIHELGHLATDEVGHTPKFWSNFKWILGEAMSIGLYTKVDFDNEPQKYCGINITSSIV